MALVSAVLADVPRTMNYQGKLTDPSGVAVSGPVDITFRIYDVASGGSHLWTETHAGVTVTNGLFDVILGESTPIALDFDEPYWIELEIGGEILAPREKLTAVSYAHRAVYADTAEFVVGGGLPSGTENQTLRRNSSDWEATSDLVVTSSGNVGIGTASPTYDLEVNGSVFGSEATFGNSTAGFIGLGPDFYGGEIGLFDFGADKIIAGKHWTGTYAGSYQYGGEYGSTEGIYVNSTGVGVGTQSPSELLHIDSGDLLIQGSDRAAMQIGEGFDYNEMILDYDALDEGTNLFFRAYGIDRITFRNNGNVGIGTTSPSTQLHTTGGVRFAGIGGSGSHLTIDAGGNLSRTTLGGGIGGSGSDNYLARWDGTSNLQNSIVYVTDAGEVGINNTTPHFRLDVHESASGAYTYPIRIQNQQATNNQGIGILFTNTSLTIDDETYSSAIVSERDGGHDLVFMTAPSLGDAPVEIMRIKGSTANVGIGTNAPSTQLHTTGGVRFAGIGGSGSHLTIDAGGNLSRTTISGGAGEWEDAGTYKRVVGNDNVRAYEAGQEYALYGRANTSGTNNYGIYGYAQSATNDYAVYGYIPTGISGDWAVYGDNSFQTGFLAGQIIGISGTWAGAYGDAHGSSTQRGTLGDSRGYGVWGSQGSGSYAGYFDGDVNIAGNLTVSGSYPGGGSSYWTLSGSNLYPNSTTYNVGVGTTSPEQKMVVEENHSGTTRYVLRNTDSSGEMIYSFSGAPSQYYAGMHLRDNYSELRLYNNFSNGYITFNNNSGTERMRIDNSGNVGIGTSSPTTQLHTTGGVRLAGIGGSGSHLTIDASGNLARTTISGSAGGWTDGGTNVYLTTSSDNVGIGTSSPTTKLHVSGNARVTTYLGVGVEPTTTNRVYASLASGNPTILGHNTFQSTDGLAGVAGTTVSAGNGYLGTYRSGIRAGVYGEAGTYSSGELHAGYFDGLTEINGELWVQDRVGFLTTTPVSDLDIEQSGGSASSEGSGGINLRNGSYYWRIYNSNDYVRFNYSNDSGASYTPKAYVNSSDGSWVSLSDRRLKTDIVSIGDVLSSVLKLEPKRFRYIANDANTPASIGFIAQDVRELFPEITSQEQEDEYIGIAYSHLGVLSIKAIQEQQTIIQTQQKTIERLQSQIDDLINRMEALEQSR